MKHDRKQIIHRISDLLDHKCEPCPRRDSAGNHAKACTGCAVYLELQELGAMLDETRGKKKVVEELPKIEELTVEKYVELKKQGYSADEIAKMAGISKQKLYNWAAYRKLKIKSLLDQKDPAQEEPQPQEVAPPDGTEDWKLKYKVLFTKHSKLEEAYRKLVEESENTHSACSDVEQELEDLRKAHEAMAKQLGQYGAATEVLQQENRAMRELLKLRL